MALINCPECGTEISDKAEKCPKCAYPIQEIQYHELSSTQTKSPQKEVQQRGAGNWFKRNWLWIVLIVSFIAFFISHDHIGAFFTIWLIAGVTYATKRVYDWSQSAIPNEVNINVSKWLLILLLIFLGVTLPFHYIPSRGMVFPKDNFTFSYTIITEDDITDLINRHNNSSLLERSSIKSEPLHRKLMEHGVIYEEGKTP